MKKLMTAVLVACAMCAFADNAAPKAAEGQARAVGAQRPQLTPEQRKERREKFMAQMKARQEAIQAKVVAALQEAGLDEAKAKDTAAKIQAIYQESRMPHPGMQGRGASRRPRPEAK